MRKEKLTFAHIERIKNGKDIELNGETYSSSSFYNVKEHSFDESFFEKNGIECCRYADNKNAKEDKKLYTLTQLTKEFELYPKSKAAVKGFMYTKKHGCYPLFSKKDCFSIAKSDEEKERNRLLKEKRKVTAKINRTCEYCDTEQQHKIERIVDDKRMCTDCYDRMCDINRFKTGNEVTAFLKGFSYTDSNLDIENYDDLEFKIVREKDNPYDENAIIVFAREKKTKAEFEKIGYIEREVASFVSPIIDEEDVTVDIKATGYFTEYYESFYDDDLGFRTKHIVFKLQKK